LISNATNANIKSREKAFFGVLTLSGSLNVQLTDALRRYVDERARYVLTTSAASDLREARAWSRARWSKELKTRYFDDPREGAQFIAENQSALRGK
jgi:hypothetical protein